VSLDQVVWLAWPDRQPAVLLAMLSKRVLAAVILAAMVLAVGGVVLSAIG
jgi:hypothetical protein